MKLFSLSPIESMFLIVFLVLVFFMVIRELVTWYWKINKITALLDKIEKNTSKNDSPKDIATQIK